MKQAIPIKCRLKLSGLFCLILAVYGVFINTSIIAQTDTLLRKKFKMTSTAFGGVSVLATNVNDQFTVMTGGRGSATFNQRYTFGGAGWGMINGVGLENNNDGTFNFFKFGYGGLEFGYVIYSKEKIKFGANILTAMGIGFKETVPKSKNGDTKFFPLFEPSIYSQIPLGKLFIVDIGIKYRYVTPTHISYISSEKLGGVSVYIAFLIGKCACK